MKKKIAVLGANEPLRSFFRQTKQLGYEIHCFAWESGAVCKTYADFFYPISFTEKEKILQKCKEIGIHGITSFSLESALPTVNFVARALGLEGNPESCELVTANKYVMRERLQNAFVKIPAYRVVSNEEALDIAEFIFPQIVKPVDSGGSRGVTLVNDFDELKKAYRRALNFSKSRLVLAEQYIDGREFSVEYISFRGSHYFLAITDKVTTGPPYFVELEHHQPALVDSETEKKLKDITRQTLDALNIFSGATHTEIKMDQTGELYIIEMGPRMGGDMISSDLVRLSTGYDFVKAVVELSTGVFDVPAIITKKYSGIYYLANESAKVYEYIVHADRYPEIVDKALFTSEIINIRESNDRAGYFIYQADKKFRLELQV